MAGGAAMLGAMRAIALLKPQVRVIAGCLRGGEHAQRYGAKAGRRADGRCRGKTIEIINTDAEGAAGAG